MGTIPIIFLNAARLLLHSLREVAYEDMARQALGWVPEDAEIEKKPRTRHPLRLDISVARKNRLGWARRRIGHLPQ